MSRMTEQDLAHLHESAVAEAAGDAERALAHHEAVRPFPDNSHRVMLRQLVELGDAVPAWGHARWILEQVTRWITGGTVASHRLGREGAIRAAHAIGLDRRQPYGFRVEEFCGLLLGHDWIYRQLVVFEFYGLKDFLELEAGPELVARAGPIHAWAESAMGGFRFEGDGGGRATFTDLSTGTEVDVLDLGCAGQLRIGDYAIGRVVPIETQPGLLFESLPLPVSAALATRVADNPDRWLMELQQRLSGGPLPDAVLLAGTAPAAHRRPRVGLAVRVRGRSGGAAASDRSAFCSSRPRGRGRCGGLLRQHAGGVVLAADRGAPECRSGVCLRGPASGSDGGAARAADRGPARDGPA